MALGLVLTAAAFTADAGVVIGAHTSPSSAVAVAILALAWLLSLAAFAELRRSDHGGDGPGGGPPDPPPEPPWWPEFERELRDYLDRNPSPGRGHNRGRERVLT